MIRARLAQPRRSRLALRGLSGTAQSAFRPTSVSGLGGPHPEPEERAVLGSYVRESSHDE